MTQPRHVVFSHGQESGPWGAKITALAETARSEGYGAESIDYQGIDSPSERLVKLMDGCKALQGELVLVGSSMGAYVSMRAAALLHVRALFLIAPALTLPGEPSAAEKLHPCPMTLVHGWLDDVVPVEQSMAFAREHGCALHILNDGHRLQESVRQIKHLFEDFLVALDLPPPLR